MHTHAHARAQLEVILALPLPLCVGLGLVNITFHASVSLLVKQQQRNPFYRVAAGFNDGHRVSAEHGA